MLVQKKRIAIQGYGNKKERQGVVMEGADNRWKQEAGQDSHYGYVSRRDTATESQVHEHNGCRKRQCLEYAKALHAQHAETFVPHSAEQSGEIIVIVVGHGFRIVEDVLEERVRKARIDTVDALYPN